MGLLTKRFIPEKKGKKKSRTVAKPKKVKLETNKKFAQIYKDLKKEQTEDKKDSKSATLDLDWLASLGKKVDSAVAATAAVAVQAAATAIESTTATWRGLVRLEPFWRPAKEDPDFLEQKKFVKEDCKQQLLATKRKLKGRMQI